MKKYTSERGVVTTTRPYRDLQADEREEILADSLKMPRDDLLKKWNITRQTLNHLKFHYKEALAEIEEENLKKAGL